MCITTTKYIFASDLSNNAWFAIARNEYSQENNPSILLNPINGITPSENLYTGVTIQGSLTAGNSTPFPYPTSIYRGTSTDLKLSGLPYPIQTDGNVQYSPCLFSKIESQFGNQVFIKSGNTSYPLAMGNNNEAIMAYFLASGVENLDKGFIIQGQFYGLLNNGIYSLQFSNGVVTDVHFIVDIANMQYVGNTPYMAIFFSKRYNGYIRHVNSNIRTPMDPAIRNI